MVSGKTNPLLSLINHQPGIDKINLYVKDLYETKYSFIKNKRAKVGLMHFEDPKAFIENSSDIKDVYKNICGYNLRKKCKILIASEHTLRFRIIGGLE